MQVLSLEQENLVAGGSTISDIAKVAGEIGGAAVKEISVPIATLATVYDLANKAADYISARQDAQIAAERAAADQAMQATLKAAADKAASDRYQDQIDKQLEKQLGSGGASGGGGGNGVSGRSNVFDEDMEDVE